MQRIIERRQKLHELYAQHSGLVNASRLAHLNGERVQISSEQMQKLWSETPVKFGEVAAWNCVCTCAVLQINLFIL